MNLYYAVGVIWAEFVSTSSSSLDMHTSVEGIGDGEAGAGGGRGTLQKGPGESTTV